METKIGKVVNYFTNIGVAVFDLTDGALSVGDTVHIKGHTTDLSQIIEEMQVEHKNVEKAEKGMMIGVKMDDRVRNDDEIFLVTMKGE
jgi:putative protease